MAEVTGSNPVAPTRFFKQMAFVTFVEMPIFSRRIAEVMDDGEYGRLQESLSRCPEQGALIPGGRGIRKMRWAARGRGKRGGARVVYYCATASGQILMLFVYAKSEKEDLTAEQLKILRDTVAKEYPT